MNPTISLLRALRKALPDTEIAVTHERQWHSLTFSGVQICVSVTLHGNGHAVAAAALGRALPSHQFDLRGQLVADIAVTGQVSGESETRIVIDALLLND